MIGLATPLNIVTPPAVEPVTLAQAQNALRVDDVNNTAENALISSLITSARCYCETYTGRCFVTTTFDLYLDGFPYAGGYFNRQVRLNPTLLHWLPTNMGVIAIPRPPLQSVTSIQYYDAQNNLTTLPTSVYTVKAFSEGQGKVVNAYNQLFPLTLNMIDSVFIRFVAGYGDATAVPEGIKNAILYLVGHWYNHRQAVSDITYNEVPLVVNAMLAPYMWGGWA